MKKVFPVLFVSTTTLIAVVGVCGTFNGSFRQLHAEEHEYTIEFKSADITNPSTSRDYYDSATFSFSKNTQSGFDFGATVTVKGDRISVKSSSHMVEVENSGYYDPEIHTAFEFHNVSSAVSVTLKGNLDRSNSKTYTNTTTITDGFKIAIDEVFEEDFYIDSIVVKYTCSY